MPKPKRREYNRAWAAAHKEHLTNYRRKHMAKRYAVTKRLLQQNPEKNKAHCKVFRALKTGKLVRLDHCSSCGLVCKPQAHHPDYFKPLEVIWLCVNCHSLVHHD